MKKFAALLCLLALSCCLCACGASPDEPQDDGPSLSEVMADKNRQDDDSPSQKPQPEETLAPSTLYAGDTFTLTIREITDRLNTVGGELCPGMTAHLVANEWIAITELRYNDVTICELSYYNSDSYLGNPLPEDPMTGEMVDQQGIRYVNVLDYPQRPHPDNSFWAIAMTFDPLITQAQAQELADFLRETRGEYRECHLVTAVNGIGYGHAYPESQIEVSGSFVIQAGCTSPELCVHDVEYEFTQDGAPYGQCSKCGDFVLPAALGQYLIDMTVVADTNGASKKDIMTGQWEDPAGARYWNALKFWVIDREGYNNTESITYSLDKDYSTLCGTIVSAAESDAGAEMWIEVYLDDRLIYTSETVDYYGYATYMVDISGGSSIRIVCATDTNANAHCVVTAMVY